MNILVACEESQRVCSAFRAKGHNAFSCDIIECSGGHPDWHIKQDVIPLLNGNCDFNTVDGTAHTINNKWDMIIAHPPCTYLTNACTRAFSLKSTPAFKAYDGRDLERCNEACRIACVPLQSNYIKSLSKLRQCKTLNLVQELGKQVQPFTFILAVTVSSVIQVIVVINADRL